MADSKICTSCGSDLTRGCFYTRSSDSPLLFNYVVWVESEKKDLVKQVGLDASLLQYPVTPYKCANCGHIDFFVDTFESWRQ